MELIFDKDMFSDAMASLDIDTEKLPLGALSQAQVNQGFSVLEEIQQELERTKPRQQELMTLSSRFFTVIPHAFGRSRPPLIDSMVKVQEKYDLMAVLADIEQANKMLENAED